MAFVDWQRKAARQIRPVFRRPAFAAGGPLPALRVVAKHPVLFSCTLAAVLACLVVALVPSAVPETPKAASLPAPVEPKAPAWLDVIKPIEIFSLEAANLAKSTKLYKARRSLDGGGRQDTLAFGTLTGDEPALRLTLYRRGSETYVAGPVFAAIARIAADAGLSVTRSGLPDVMATRFGNFQVAAVALSAGATPASPCSGFRLALDAPALTMTGLACGGKAADLTRERLGCMLERLDLVSGGDDRALVEFFASTELKRNAACTGMRLGPDEPHAAWLDDRAATPRKIVRHR
ncbi:hypothetical protein [Beijerinckia sp. L45]|uniref:hypothetical protein n=1 Tax=Beijerinckia sp. L45 TaxID=1641855 RepID=UPI00131C0B6E|nr:hypothetical protein [Beijerinckia sp. L45]